MKTPLVAPFSTSVSKLQNSRIGCIARSMDHLSFKAWNHSCISMLAFHNLSCECLSDFMEQHY